MREATNTMTKSSHARNAKSVFSVALVLVAFGTSPADRKARSARADGTTTSASERSSVIFLFRHAELAVRDGDNPRDRPLSSEGKARAARLGKMLAESGITNIYSTNLQRTRDTADPLSKKTGINIDFYGPGDLRKFADRLKSQAGVYAVSGHSNTTPQMVRFLGGDPGPPIDDRTEFDRLYIVVVSPKGHVTTTMLRY